MYRFLRHLTGRLPFERENDSEKPAISAKRLCNVPAPVIQEERRHQRKQDRRGKDLYGDEKGCEGYPMAGHSCYDVVAYEESFLQGSGGLKVAISQLQVPRAAALLEQ